MNLDDLLSGKVDLESLSDKPTPPSTKPDTTSFDKLVDDTPSVAKKPDFRKTAAEAPSVETPVVEETPPAPVAPPKPAVTPGAPVLGYVNEPSATMYAHNPVPGADMPGPQQQARQMVKDFVSLQLIAGVGGILVIAAFGVLPKFFGVDMPGVKGNPDAPWAWNKKEAVKPVTAPVVPTPDPAPAKTETPAPVAPVAPAVEVAPAPAAPIDVPVAPAAPDAALAATVQTPVPQSAPAVGSSAAQEAPVATQPAPAPAPAAQVVPVAPAASVPQPIHREERVAPVKKVSPPKRVVQPSQGPVPGSLEYAEQQMRQFTQPGR